jgi:hypothetical protein
MQKFSNKFIYLFFFILIFLITVSSKLMFPGHPFFYTKNIHLYYIAAADKLFNYGIPPFTWRILQPVLVNTLPFDKTISFFLISIVSLFFLTGLLYKLLIIILKDKELSFSGAVLFLSIVWAVRYNIIEFWYPDLLFYFFIMLCLYSIFTHRKILFAVSLVFGALTKEMMFLIIPLYYTINSKEISLKKFNKRLLKETFILSAPAVLVFIIVGVISKKSIDASVLPVWFNDVFLYRIEALIGLRSSLNFNIINEQPGWLTFLINWYRITLGAFGGFFIISFLVFKENRKLFKVYIPFFLLVFLLLFIARDSERLVTVLFFPVILVTLNSVKIIINEYNVDKNYFRIYILLFFIIQFFFRGNIYFEIYYAVFAQTILSIIFFVFLFFKKKGMLVPV